MKIYVGTHDGIFHCDDVMCFAILKLLHEDLFLIRSRREEDLKKCNIIFDVGGELNPEKGVFDHHFKKPPTRNNGIPYAASGLIWDYYGKDLLKKKLPNKTLSEIDLLHKKIDQTLIQSIDAHDTGYYPSYRDFHYTLPQTLNSFIPCWNTEFFSQDLDKRFQEAAQACAIILKNNINYQASLIEAEDMILKKYKQSLHKGIIVINHYIPFNNCVLKHGLNVDFVIYKMKEDEWIIHSAFRRLGDRKLFPQSWAGKEKEDLEKASGIKGALFCHHHRFVAGHKTSLGAIKMAQEAQLF